MEPDWSTTKMMSDGTATKSALTSLPAHAALHVPLLQTGVGSLQSALVSQPTHDPLVLQIGNSAGQSDVVEQASPGPASTPSSPPAPLLGPHAATASIPVSTTPIASLIIVLPEYATISRPSSSCSSHPRASARGSSSCRRCRRPAEPRACLLYTSPS